MKLNNYIALLGCILLLFSQMFWYMLGMPELYYLADATFKVAILFSFSRLVMAGSFTWFIVFDFFFNLSVGNLIDELFFNPEAIQVNEYLCFMATAVIAIFRWLSHSTRLPMSLLLKRILWNQHS